MSGVLSTLVTTLVRSSLLAADRCVGARRGRSCIDEHATRSAWESRHAAATHDGTALPCVSPSSLAADDDEDDAKHITSVMVLLLPRRGGAAVAIVACLCFLFFLFRVKEKGNPRFL